MSKLYVYGCRAWNPDTGRQTRVVAAVKSRAEFCRITGITDNEAKTYGSETGNPGEVVAATAFPGVALYHLSDRGSSTPKFITRDGRRIAVRLVAVEEVSQP